MDDWPLSKPEPQHPEPADSAYEGWAIVELMGHRQTAGYVRDVQLAGTTMLRIDTPGPNGEMVASQFYGGSALYCVTPCDEAAARRALEDAYNLPPPISLALRFDHKARNPELSFDGQEDPDEFDEPDYSDLEDDPDYQQEAT